MFGHYTTGPGVAVAEYSRGDRLLQSGPLVWLLPRIRAAVTQA